MNRQHSMEMINKKKSIMARLICKRRLMESEHLTAMGSLLCMREKNPFKYIFLLGESKEIDLCFINRIKT